MWKSREQKCMREQVLELQLRNRNARASNLPSAFPSVWQSAAYVMWRGGGHGNARGSCGGGHTIARVSQATFPFMMSGATHNSDDDMGPPHDTGRKVTGQKPLQFSRQPSTPPTGHYALHRAFSQKVSNFIRSRRHLRFHRTKCGKRS